MAPEILRGEKYEEGSDVYSFGVVLLELFTGKIPHKDLSLPQITGLVGFNENYEVQQSFNQLQIPEDVPHPLLGELIRMCTRRDPKARPSFEAILEFVTEHQDQILKDGSLF